MRCFLVALGTRGEVEIFLTLGKAMKERGHEVVMGVSPFFQNRVQALGFDWISLGDSPLDQVVAVLNQLEAVSEKLDRQTYFFDRWVKPQRNRAIPAIAQAAYTTDYFISNIQLAITRNGYRIPGATVIYDPVPSDKKPEIQKSCTLALKTQTHPVTDTTLQGVHSIVLVALNKMLIDPDNQWGRTYQFTGYWYDDYQFPDWHPTDELRGFVYAGSPPVVLTMGSVVTFDVAQLVELFCAALNLSDQRGIIVSGWAALDQVKALVNTMAPAQVIGVAEIPYHWLLPQSGCVIHAGGTGTVGSVLRSGVPSILIPQLSSQEVCSRTLIHHQLAAGVFDLNSLTPAILAEAIEKATTDPVYRNNAQFWQTIVGNEDGVQIAADMIEAHWERLVNIPGATGRFQELR